MKAADSFSSKMDRRKKKRMSAADDGDLELVSDTRGGISLDDTIEDDVFDTAELMATARSGRGLDGKKVDTSLQGRITKWAGETQEFVQNPTQIQITYATIFLSSVAILFLVGLLTFVVGGVKFRGDSLEVYKRRQRELQDPYMQRFAIMQENMRRMASVDDIRDLSKPGSIGIRTNDEIYSGVLAPEYGGPNLTQEEIDALPLDRKSQIAKNRADRLAKEAKQRKERAEANGEAAPAEAAKGETAGATPAAAAPAKGESAGAAPAAAAAAQGESASAAPAAAAPAGEAAGASASAAPAAP